MKSPAFRIAASCGALWPRLLAGILLLAPEVFVYAEGRPFTWTTLAGLPGTSGTADGTAAARFSSPAAVCVDDAGTVYVADAGNHAIRRVTPGGVVTTLAGAPGESGTADGTGSAARFNQPGGLILDAAGTLYVADTGNHAIRKVTPAGVVTTLAGLPGQPGTVGGMGTAARFRSPAALTFGPEASIFVTDTGNHTVRRVSLAGEVITIIGCDGVPGTGDGPIGSAKFNSPSGIAWDGYYFRVADTGNHTIRKIDYWWRTLETVSGAAGEAGDADGTGSAIRFSRPRTISLVAGGSFLITSEDGHSVRLFSGQRSEAVAVTLGGVSLASGTEDGDGSAARFRHPAGAVAGPGGVIYLADRDNHRVSIGRIKPLPNQMRWEVFSGSQFEGSTDGPLAQARFTAPGGMVRDDSGNLLLTDYKVIRKISRSGEVTTLAGRADLPGSIEDGTGEEARFTALAGMALDRASGTMFVTDPGSHRIRAVTAAGVVSTVAGFAHQGDDYLRSPAAITLLPNGDLAMADGGLVVRRVTRAGAMTFLAGSFEQPAVTHVDGPGAVARFGYITGLAADKAGNIYVGDRATSTIRKILPSGEVVTVAGVPFAAAHVDGTGAAARLMAPGFMSMSDSGDLYFADTGSESIRRMSPEGTVTTLSGNSGRWGMFSGGPADALRFFHCSAIVAAPDGSIYVSGGYGSGIGIIRGLRPGSGIERLDNGAMSLLFTTDHGFSGCEVQRAGSPEGPWASLGSFIASPGGTVSLTDTAPPDGRAFYRLKTLFTR